ncbi:MAG TPA: glycosyltransferase [Nitrospira sp.]|nr:glycosyltransferase [Nitrospira sp.]
MARIGLLGPGVPGHWNPTSCLARALQANGHVVIAFQLTYFEDAVRRSGMEYCPIGEKLYPVSRMKESYAHVGRLEGRELLRYTISRFIEQSEMYLCEGPELVGRNGIDFLLVDQAEPAGASIAERLGIPFVTISNALILDQEPGIPPLFTTWPYSPRFTAKIRNRVVNELANRMGKPLLRSINARRREWNLPEYGSLWESTSPIAHISQQPACFDFPRQQLPPQFHYTGPWHNPAARPEVPFPYEKLDGRQLIYASMGTIQNRVQEVFGDIAVACEGLDAQLVISLGGGASPEQIDRLPGNPIVVPIAPQLDLLARAALTITHAGLNTVLESLSHGVPMVAIPVGNDQPGVASRLKWVGAGEFLPIKQLNAARLKPLIRRVLGEPSYHRRAQEMMGRIKKADGVRQAVELIEGALTNNAQSSGHLVHQA